MDLIKREVAIDALNRRKDKSAKGDIGSFYNKIIENDIDAIKALPSAEPVRKGKWIEEKEDWRNQIMWVSCSECGFASGTSYNFCPNCGAQMTKGEEDERKKSVYVGQGLQR